MQPSPDSIATIRRFNRFYTQRIGALAERYMGGPYSLAELRLLHEVGHRPGITASALAERLGMDHGFLSRKIAGLSRRRVLKRARSKEDGRVFHLSLTALGEKQLPRLEETANMQAARMMEGLTPERREALVNAMGRVERILGDPTPAPIIFRQLSHGDAGWIIHRHGAIIAREFGWNHEFEALCAQIMADFIRNYQPEWERSWVVERDGDILGSLFLIREDATTARLRLLYVEAAARGLGLATKLLEKSFEFARSKGYARVVLFTTDSNIAARRIYEKLDMTLETSEPFAFAGKQQQGETWAIAL
jgi:DNA-binding MarR family transcriptional regulator/GNAT superfamily N-acetyltransferase